MLPETDLLTRCRAQDPRAQRLLYDRFAPKMLAVAKRYVRNDDDAHDVLAEAFIKVFRYLDQFAGRGELAGWIRRIVVHEALRHLRRRGTLTISLDDETGSGAHFAQRLSTPATAETELAAAELWALLDTLPAGYRTVFNLYAVDGLTHPQIAEQLGITEGTSKSQLFKARTLLRKGLRVRGFEGERVRGFEGERAKQPECVPA